MSTVPAITYNPTPTLNSTTVSYNISQPTTDDSTSVYITASQDTTTLSFQSTASQDTTTLSFQSTKQTTPVAVIPTNGSTVQSNTSNSSRTTSNVTPRSTPNNSLVSNVMVNASTVATPAVPLYVSTTINSTARSTRASSSTTRVTATTGTQPRSSRVSMPPLNPVTVNTGFSKGPVIIPASGTTSINNVKIDCGAPPSIEGATTISSGPYRVGMSAVYTCLSGYTMTGAASLLCGTDLKWSQSGPQCIGPSGGGGAEAHTGLERELAGMPVWMAIIIAVAVGVVCLILLTCLLIMCMRIFGCWKGSFIEGSPRQSSQVYPEKTPLAVTRATSAIIVNEKRMKDPSTLQVEDHVFVRDNHFHDNGQPPQSHRLPPRPVHVTNNLNSF